MKIVHHAIGCPAKYGTRAACTCGAIVNVPNKIAEAMSQFGREALAELSPPNRHVESVRRRYRDLSIAARTSRPFRQRDYNAIVNSLDKAMKQVRSLGLTEKDAQRWLRAFLREHYFPVWRTWAK